MAIIRLDKFFSELELFSRTEIKTVLKNGRISVNGVPAKSSSQKVDSQKDCILLDGKEVQYEPYVYIMLNKPQGVVSATDDKKHKTVLDLVPPDLFRRGLFPAGRLDKDTTGFVLLTNDGNFAHEILSPGKHVSKTYLVTASALLSKDAIQMIEEGITLSDETKCAPAKLTLLSKDALLYEIVITEGKYHQIKRMFAAAGSHVDALKRIKIGGLSLDENLPEGACKVILHKEIERILCK